MSAELVGLIVTVVTVEAEDAEALHSVAVVVLVGWRMEAVWAMCGFTTTLVTG